MAQHCLGGKAERSAWQKMKYFDRFSTYHFFSLILLSAAWTLAGVLAAAPAQAQCTPVSPCGELTDLGTLGGDWSSAAGINADGTVVVGRATNANGFTRAFRWEGGAMTDLGTLWEGGSSEAHGVNADGTVVVGGATNANGFTRAFRWEGGAMTDLGTLGGQNS